MRKDGSISITKASGEIVAFSSEKLKHSLLKSGASEGQAEEIIMKIEERLYPGISTRKIYQQSFKMLRKISGPSAARYKLKNAIMELGPSGFPFEKFVAAIMHQLGYNVQTDIIVQGHCVKHEIDIIAEKNEQHFMIECKYHNQTGSVCNVKIPLYIYSRFWDVKESWVKLPAHDVKLHQGWVVTNTRFTEDAVQYGICAGLKLLGWNFPADSGLNKLIDQTGLYPITCLTTLSKNEKQFLLNNNVVLSMEICNKPELLTQAGISSSKFNSVVEECNQLCLKILNTSH